MGFTIDENTQNIRITRGDSGIAESELCIGDGQDAVLYEMQEGDVISLGVKADYEDAECIIRKDVHENPAVFEFVPSDTKDLDFGTYYYDVQFVRGSDGFTVTYIEKKKFKVTEEVV